LRTLDLDVLRAVLSEMLNRDDDAGEVIYRLLLVSVIPPMWLRSGV